MFKGILLNPRLQRFSPVFYSRVCFQIFVYMAQGMDGLRLFIYFLNMDAIVPAPFVFDLKEEAFGFFSIRYDVLSFM